MKKIIMLLGVFISIFEMASQEIDTNRNFVFKTNGEIVYGRYITSKNPIFKKDYLVIDDQKILNTEVQFYKSDSGFFGRVGKGNAGFAERIVKGKVNFFEQISTSYAAPMPMAGGFGMSMGRTSTTITNYYNKGFESLKLANYDNLIIDLKDNAESVVYLEKFHKAKGKRTLAYVLGGIAMVAGILTASKKTGETTRGYNQDTNRIEDMPVTELKPVNLAIGLAGFGTIIATYLSSRKKRDYVRKAIEVYNE
ncbi:hypothetical protein [Flavicella sediminum]|uniref:hypothetical protein n=1 Tax=Flavicella sediminum TaxID=2585141 RepID=UPI00111D5CFE|nr:hypothetical protein [Flavicella sediminum]